jgi:mono/diheme cytochrome c family protein
MKLLVMTLAAALAGSAAMTAQDKPIADIYGDKCAVCHGQDGAGRTAKGKQLKVKDVREQNAKLTAAQMIEVVIKGKGEDMDGFGKEFTADQIKALVDYYRGLATATKK